jgi:hypothetical protein
MTAGKQPKPAEIRKLLRKKLGFSIDSHGWLDSGDGGSGHASDEERKLWRLAWRLVRERLTKNDDNACGCPVWGTHRITCRRSFT